MIERGQDILKKLKQRWQMRLWGEVLLYASGSAFLVWFLFSNPIYATITFLVTGSLIAIIKRPWALGVEKVSSFLDRHLNSLEYSTGLLLIPQEQLSGIARLQQERTSRELEAEIKNIKPQDGFLKAVIISAGLILVGFLINSTGLTEMMRSNKASPVENEIIVFQPADSVVSKIPQPQLVKQQAVISFPAYTGIGKQVTSNMNVKVVEGSTVTWELGFDSQVDSVSIETSGGRYPMKFSGKSFSHSSVLQNVGFYNFRFMDTLGASYVSDLYAIEIIRDQGPDIEITGLQPFVSFDHDEEKHISFSARISDDFGVGEALIIATVSKGTGESVKFREEKLRFDNSYESGSKNLQLQKRLNLDQMKMEPGDELYFYIQASDLKTPLANISRSETYFAVINDTASTGFGMESTLGVDLMPDYFRSQRQLIIDTEKLISQRPSISKEKFNATSNDLGFDQKSLRLKYGQFMGDENEGAIAGNLEMPEVDDEDPEDPLAEFTHDHDGDNEHNLVQHDHPEDEENEEESDPLSEFLHDHGDPESATLFTDNLRSKIRQALDIMWDAELHLRLYEPEKSLQFQYRALALLQEIKNSARIYVHRIGYDPPPIKEDVRLTGKIDEVSGFQKTEDIEQEDMHFHMRKSIAKLEQLISGRSKITASDRQMFELAAHELAILAIESPGNYLNTLQELKWLSEKKPVERKKLKEIQNGLLNALPTPPANARKPKSSFDELNNLLLQELQRNEQ